MERLPQQLKALRIVGWCAAFRITGAADTQALPMAVGQRNSPVTDAFLPL